MAEATLVKPGTEAAAKTEVLETPKGVTPDVTDLKSKEPAVDDLALPEESGDGEPELDEATQAVLDARLAKALQDKEESDAAAAEAKRAEDSAAERRKQHRTAVKTYEERLPGRVTAYLRSLNVLEDNQTATEEQIAPFRNDFQAFNRDAQGAADWHRDEVWLADARSFVKKGDQAAFDVAVDKAETTKDILDALIERAAPQAKSVKTMLKGIKTVDELKALSPDLYGVVADWGRKQRKFGEQNPRPAGEPGSGGGNGALPVGTYAEFLALPEKDKQAFTQAHPEKFREFLGIGK